jgi:hypothetical protein
MHRTGASAYILMRMAGMSPSQAVTSLKQMREITHDELVKERKEGQTIQDIAEGFFAAMPAPTPAPQSSISNQSAREDAATKSEAAVATTATKTTMATDMHGQFPIFEGNILPHVREAIAGRLEFVERRYDDYIAFDYKNASPGTFSSSAAATAKQNAKNRYLGAVRRECRGLLLCAHTGRVLARRFHKFFNVNENAEASDANIALPSAEALLCCSVTFKLDGSLCSPFLVPSPSPSCCDSTYPCQSSPSLSPPTLKWATRCVENDDIPRFCAEEAPHMGYAALCRHFLNNNVTPLFEWSEAAKIVGVIKHAENSLILLAARNNRCGSYVSHAELTEAARQHHVPLVKRHSVESIPITAAAATASTDPAVAAASTDTITHRPLMLSLHEWLRVVREWDGQEGVVLSLPDNQTKYTIKTSWYVACASATTVHGSADSKHYALLEMLKKRPSLRAVPARFIWQTCLGKDSDDVVSMCSSLLVESGATAMACALLAFHTHVGEYTRKLHVEMAAWGQQVKTNRQSDLAVSQGCARGWTASVLLAFVHAKDSAGVLLLKFLAAVVQKNDLEALQVLLGIRWDEESAQCVFNTTVIEQCELGSCAVAGNSGIDTDTESKTTKNTPSDGRERLGK